MHSNPSPHNLMMLAQALATVKHTGQTRKGTGEPYTQHLIRVAGRVTTVRQRTIALLHDILEDTDMTVMALRIAGFPWDIIEDVIALSRKTFGETYDEFIQRTIRDGSDDALEVKLADLMDNLCDDWTQWQPDTLRARYIKADVQIRRELRNRQIKREVKAQVLGV